MRPRTRSIPVSRSSISVSASWPTRSLRTVQSTATNLSYVGDRVTWKSRSFRGQQHVARAGRPAKITRERNNDNGREPACIERVPLKEHHRSIEAGTRAGRIRERCPANIALADHHSAELEHPSADLDGPAVDAVSELVDKLID